MPKDSAPSSTSLPDRRPTRVDAGQNSNTPPQAAILPRGSHAAAHAAMTHCRARAIGSLSARRTRARTLRPLASGVRTYSSQHQDHGNDVAILGGGITGLASAYYLTKQIPHAKITVYEASDRLGGWLSSKRVPVKDGNVLFEAGPRTLRPASNGVLSARLVCCGRARR